MRYTKKQIQDLIVETAKKKLEVIEETTTAAIGGGGGYSSENAETGGFFIGPLSNISRKDVNRRVSFKDGAVYNKSDDKPVTEQMITEWFGRESVKGFNAKPYYKGGSFVEIKPKCLTFPYCSEGDSDDQPIKLIGETRELSSPCAWDIVEVLAEAAHKEPKYVASLIREYYLKLENNG